MTTEKALRRFSGLLSFNKKGIIILCVFQLKRVL